MPLIAIALLVAAALGGGVSAAAQTSLPGDPLWGFKTTINENVAGALAIGDQAKANWDISVATARLDEAQKLAAEGKLNADAQSALTTNFDAHAKDVAALVAKLEAGGNAGAATDVATRFQAALASHASAVAEASASQGTSTEADVQPFLASIRGTLDEAANLSASSSAELEHEDAATSSTEGSPVRGEMKINTGASGEAQDGNADGSASGTVKVNIY